MSTATCSSSHCCRIHGLAHSSFTFRPSQHAPVPATARRRHCEAAAASSSGTQHQAQIGGSPPPLPRLAQRGASLVGPSLRRFVLPRVAAPWQTCEPSTAPAFTAEEAARYGADQLAFLERKRRGIMPRGNTCDTCEGIGTVICHACRGTGINAYQVDEEMFEGGTIYQFNGRVDVQPFFKKDWPCWLCRGKEHIGCKDCEGAGMRGISQLYTGD